MNEEKVKKTSFMMEIVKFLLLILVTVVPFRVFVAEPYIVSGVSMSNTLETGHYLIINKFNHKFNGLERGDLVVFIPPKDQSKTYIKRVLALPGETIRISEGEVFIKTVDSSEFQKVEEPYISTKTVRNQEAKIPKGEYFVMGDNRQNSSDSRAWGPIKKDSIKGEPVLRLFPFSQINLLPGQYEEYNI